MIYGKRMFSHDEVLSVERDFFLGYFIIEKEYSRNVKFIFDYKK